MSRDDFPNWELTSHGLLHWLGWLSGMLAAGDGPGDSCLRRVRR